MKTEIKKPAPAAGQVKITQARIESIRQIFNMHIRKAVNWNGGCRSNDCQHRYQLNREAILELDFLPRHSIKKIEECDDADFPYRHSDIDFLAKLLLTKAKISAIKKRSLKLAQDAPSLKVYNEAQSYCDEFCKTLSDNIGGKVSVAELEKEVLQEADQILRKHYGKKYLCYETKEESK